MKIWYILCISIFFGTIACESRFPCQEDSHCPGGECRGGFCHNRSVTPDCQTDADCKHPDKPKCEKQTCVPASSDCQADADCKDPGKPKCEKQTCVPASSDCQTDADCKDPGKPKCEKQTCVPATKVNNLIVTVFDDQNKAISNALVRIAGKDALTDDSGFAIIESRETINDVHVFHKDYSYFSVFGINQSRIFIQLVKNQDRNVAGGAKGKLNFDKLQDVLEIPKDKWSNYTVGFGIAGLSLPINILDLDLDMLLGEQFKVKLFDRYINLPSGLFIELAEGGGKDQYLALGKEGPRLVWGFGGKFTQDEVKALLPADSKNVNFSEILSKIKPIFSRMGFGIRTQIEVKLHPRVPDVEDQNGDGRKDDLIPDASKFIDSDLIIQHKLDKKLTVIFSNVPSVQHKGKSLDLLLISLSGAAIPGFGFVPTGLMIEQSNGGSVNMNVNHYTNENISTTSLFAVMNFALTLPIGEDPPPSYIYGDIQLFPAQPSKVVVPKFVDAPTQAKFDPITRKLEGSSTPNADLFHFTFTKDGQKWIVFYAGDRDGFELPLPPDGFADRIDIDGEASLQAVALKQEQTLESIISHNSLNIDRLISVINGFSKVSVYTK